MLYFLLTFDGLKAFSGVLLEMRVIDQCEGKCKSKTEKDKSFLSLPFISTFRPSASSTERLAFKPWSRFRFDWF
jgi:hypothetical protein